MTSFWGELKRRNVVRVAIAYGVVAWLLLQLADVVLDNIQAPTWVFQAILLLLIIGLPLALIFAWAFELTPEGIKKEKDVDRSDSVTASTGQKLNYLIIGALLLAVGFLFLDRQTALTPTSDEIAESTSRSSDAPSPVAAQSASIAVLPFADLSPTGDREYFADGLSEEILNVLVKIDELTVASRTSSFQFKGRDIGVPEIASVLHVAYVLEGSVRTSGGNIRVTGQLIEASSDRHIWSDSFDRELTTENIFAIQDEIASAIVTALGEELGLSTEPDSVNVLGGTQNFSAYDSFLKGREVFLGRSTVRDVADSMAIFESAVDTDPRFARAWLWLSATYSVAPGWGLADGRDFAALTIAATDEALKLDSSLAFAYAVRANARTENRPPYEWEMIMAELEKASTLDPKDATTQLWMGLTYRKLGYFDRAYQHIKRCLEIDPAYENCKRHHATTQIMLNDDEGALETLWTWSDISFVRSVDLEFAPFFARIGNPVAARMVFESSIPEHFGFPMNRWVDAIKDPNNVDENLRREVVDWLDSAQIDRRIETFVLLSVGEFGEPLASTLSFDSLDPFALDDIWLPEFSEFRKTQLFKASISGLGLVGYWRANGFPTQCRPIGANDFECD